MADYVLIDRDGVINDNSMYYVLCKSDFRFLPGVLEALALLNAAGRRVIVISNQSAVGKGLLSEATLADIHRYMCKEVERHGGAIEDVFYCSDVTVEQSGRKKPAPGMLFEAAARHGFALDQTWFVGDAWTDVVAGRAAGCKTLLVGDPAAYRGPAPDRTAADLLAAVRDVILAEAAGPNHNGKKAAAPASLLAV